MKKLGYNIIWKFERKKIRVQVKGKTSTKKLMKAKTTKFYLFSSTVDAYFVKSSHNVLHLCFIYLFTSHT